MEGVAVLRSGRMRSPGPMGIVSSGKKSNTKKKKKRRRKKKIDHRFHVGRTRQKEMGGQ